MALARLRVLDRQEEDTVHSLSLRVLDEIGVRVRSRSVLGMLESAGASVDQKNEIAKLPEAMVKKAIANSPKSFTIGARKPSYDVKLPAKSWPFVSLGGVTSWIEDYPSMAHREATRKDLAKIATLADALPQVDLIWPLVTVRDVPPHSGFAHELWTCFQNTVKPIHGSAGSGTLGVVDAKVQIELGALVAGGKEQLRKKPSFTVLSCVIAPLSFEKGAVEAQCEYAKAGVPVISMSMSVGGATSPMTLTGTIVNANAENLASLVITQAASPGAPHIYSSESTLLDPRTGVIGYRRAETPLIYCACAQMAARYGLPKMTGVLGIETAREGNPINLGDATSILMSTLNGTDLCSGIGGLDSDNGCSLEEIVIDAHVWGDFRAYMRDFEVSEREAALDVMKQVGQGNTYLGHPHTLSNFRRQMHLRDKFTDAVYRTASVKKLLDDAHKFVSTTLKEHTVPPLDKDVLAKGNMIVKEYGKRS